jgi:hypothetical protein
LLQLPCPVGERIRRIRNHESPRERSSAAPIARA